MEVIQWIKENWQTIAQVYFGIIGVASIIVRLTPTLKDDTILLNIIKFIAKYLALNVPTPESKDRPL